MHKKFIISITIFICLTGCASQIKVSEIRNDLPAGSEVDGIPFRTPKRFIAVIYEKQKENGYQEVGRIPVALPDPDRLYVLGFSSQMLSNASIELSLNPDNTIQTLSLKSEERATEAVAAASAQINSTVAALHAREKALTSAATSEASLTIAADKAKQAADLAILQLELIDPNATREARVMAEQKARSAKLDANEAARLAGLPPPFKDVVAGTW